MGHIPTRKLFEETEHIAQADYDNPISCHMPMCVFFVCERLKQPHEIDVGLPTAHDALHSSPHRSKARRILLRVVSYWRSDMP